MDFLQLNIKHLLSATSSIIRREVDCMIDDLLFAKTISVLYDSSSFTLQDFIPHQSYNQENTGSSRRKNVLLCVSKDGQDVEMIEAARQYREDGDQVLTITANRKSDLADLSDRVVGFDLKLDNIDGNYNSLLYEQVIYILFTTIKQSIEKRNPVMH
ncbi:hypothetical protein LMF32_06845 [Desemzia sp. C1]|uniref:hypothetical protein n=1 Tax=Desemzia sp. C1 TaxID=2892016 RepID=UPI001E2B7AB6|nr:hypothetical protein [Desemzia sp. C1]MCI3028813.1 hypothetical protein [Desemzia sp. C1]